jgi:hypothetical protein
MVVRLSSAESLALRKMQMRCSAQSRLLGGANWVSNQVSATLSLYRADEKKATLLQSGRKFSFVRSVH